jgi:hypothetical protein
MLRSFISQFFEGRNTDTSKINLSQDQYLEAHNLELVGDGVFQALQNIKGTTDLKQIISDSTVKDIGAFPCKFLILGESKRCNLHFTISSTLFKIRCYDIDGDTLYELYEEEVESQDRIIDAVNYPEGGVDFVYFTDFYKELRFIKCEIPSPYVANYLTSFDISLQRKGALGEIELSSIGSGGSLLSGSYQFAYRMADPTNKRFTKWSSLTNPVHCYDSDNSDDPVHAGIGLLTDRKITLSITPSTLETDNFEYLQLAVVENVGVAVPVNASLLEITAIPSTSLSFEYKSNARIGEVSLADLTIDLAQIDTVKTLKVKENRLMGANVKYTPLEFDNGTPEITSGSIAISPDTGIDPFSSDYFSSTKRGHFRDEVYRFGVVYEDENGNKSPVSPLDLSSVTGNIASSGTDMRFPSRSTSNSYTLFTALGVIQSLGLSLTGLINHPSWARKLHIVRVPRKKNILFQSPAIPMVDIYGIGAFDNYPSVWETGVRNTNTNNQPQTAGKILQPKNLFWPEMKCIKPLTQNVVNGASDNTKKRGESLLQFQISSSFQMLWPSAYTTESYSFTGSEKISVIDKALLKLDCQSFNPSKSAPNQVRDGDDVNTNLSGNFYALNSGDYYFDPAWAAKSISAVEENRSIVDSENFQNFGQTASVNGVSVMDYEAMQTTGVTLGYKPNIQKSTVVQVSGDAINDICSNGAVFASGTLNAFGTGGGYIVGASGVRYENLGVPLFNDYVTKYSSFSNRAYVNACNIVNVTAGLGDDRYGDINSFHEYISTGATYTFTPSDITALENGDPVSVDLNVWGGDCFVGPQTFKIADSSYSVTNQTSASQTAAQLISKWGLYFINSYGRGMCLPVALENVGQYITVILESEYNGEVRDFDSLNPVSPSEFGFPVLNNTSKDTIRIPLSYGYNINLSKENSDKVFVTKPQYSFTENEFPARVIYSDIKIYNSDQAGFDTVRAADFYDLEEQRYGITKLALAGDNLYAIQEKGITYLPTGERQIEQTNADTLAVRSGDVIGRALIIDSKRGSQHIRGIAESGDLVFIPDNINKSVYALAGTELKPITKDNETLFRTLFASEIDESDIIGFYDFVRGEYWLVAGGRTEVFNPIGWIGDYEFTPSSGLYNEGLYLTGKVGSDLSIYSMYTGSAAPTTLFGEEVVPRVTFIANPESNFPKTFDVLRISSSQPLLKADLTVVGDMNFQTLSTTDVDLNVKLIEGIYKTNGLRTNIERYRLRGLLCEITMSWANRLTTLRSVDTRYYYSQRI